MKERQQGRSMIDVKTAEDTKGLEMERARKKEKQTGVAETRQIAQEIADRERQHKVQAGKAKRTRQKGARETRRIQSEAENSEELKELESDTQVMGRMVESESWAPPEPPSETVIAAVEAIRAAHTSSEPDPADGSTPSSSKLAKRPLPKSSVDALVAERVQVLKEQAGDYSRYLPELLGVGRSLGLVGPAAYAELTLARTRGVRLRRRREAVQVVERFVGMSEARAEF